MRLGNFVGVAFTLLLLSLSLSCYGPGPLAFSVDTPRTDASGITVSFGASEPLAAIDVFDSSGRLLLTQPLPLLREGEMLLPLQLRSGRLTLVARTPAGQTKAVALRLGGREGENAALRSPFHAGDASPLVLVPGSSAPLLLELKGNAGEPLLYRIAVRAAGGLELRAAGVGEEGDGETELVLEGCVGILVRPLVREILVIAPEGIGSGERAVEALAVLQSGDRTEEISLRRRVTLLSAAVLGRGIGVPAVVMPVAADGGERRGLRRDHIALGQARHGAAVVGGRPAASFQRVAVGNRLGVDIPVVVTASVVDGGGEIVPAFAPPPEVPGSAVRAVAVVPAGGEAALTLPIFADTARIEPGSYRRLIEVHLAGTDILLHSQYRPLAVDRSAPLPAAVTAVAAVAAILAVGFVVARGPKLLARFTTRQIVLVALVAAASVVLVNLPVFFLANITAALLGPLGFLVDGLLTEFLYGALLVALLAVIPRQGICAMVAGIRFLLGGVLLGMLTPFGALHTVVSAGCLETAVWLSGAARRGSADTLPLRLPILFAIANAAVSWIGFQLAVVLFRLHYASWYVALSMLLGGFVYSLIGAAVGRRVGRRLAHIAA